MVQSKWLNDAFIIGMTIGLAVLPETILSEIKRLVAE
jgi:hypothetical protein